MSLKNLNKNFNRTEMKSVRPGGDVIFASFKCGVVLSIAARFHYILDTNSHIFDLLTT